MQAEKQHVKRLPFRRKRGFWYRRKRIFERSWEHTVCRKNIFAVENSDYNGEIDLSGSYINLQVNYYIKIPISFFEVKGVGICQKSKSHKWIGDRTDGKQSDYVYVTKHGTVYHRSRKCHYLDLSIKSADYAQISSMRNKNEHKYSACSGCVAKNHVAGKVYVTDYGTCYHSDLACSGLKRTIYLILLEETGGKRACGKCGANTEVR